MNCEEVRPHVRDVVRRRLDPALQGGVGAHLASCEACSAAVEAEQALDEVLAERLPRYATPTALEMRLRLLVGRPARGRSAEPRRWTRVLAPAMAAALAVGLGGVLLQHRSSSGGELAGLTTEAVNDHLRVLASQHPVEIESGGNHQVKPWFEGKLDFAPVVPAPEVDGLRLRGGSVGYVFDRKAAVLVYGLRLHVVTLLVFRADGLDWASGGRQLGPARAVERSTRGFNVVLWREGGLGYALVSDVNAADLSEVAARFAAEISQGRGP